MNVSLTGWETDTNVTDRNLVSGIGLGEKLLQLLTTGLCSRDVRLDDSLKRAMTYDEPVSRMTL